MDVILHAMKGGRGSSRGAASVTRPAARPRTPRNDYFGAPQGESAFIKAKQLPTPQLTHAMHEGMALFVGILGSLGGDRRPFIELCKVMCAVGLPRTAGKCWQ